MLLQIKNLHNDTFTVDIHENETVRTLKENIGARDDLREKYDPDLLKLLCTGKVMDDEDALNSFTIKPDGFLVLVKQTPGKPKPPPKKKPNQGFNNPMGGFNSPFGMSQMPNSFMNQPFQQNSFMQQPFQQDAFAQQSFKPPALTPQSQLPATETTGDLSHTTPEDQEEALQSLLAMGFDRSQSEKALRACLYNLHAALDYLTSGNMPSEDENPTPPQGPGSNQTSSTSIISGNQTSLPAHPRQSGGDAAASLQAMGQMLQQNPDQLQALKQKIIAEHPEVAQLIDDDPQGFLDLIQQAGGVDGDRTPSNSSAASGTDAMGNQGRAPVTVSITAQEQESINRLQEMGFERSRVIEAFLACDRNEDLAVNYLLNAFD